MHFNKAIKIGNYTISRTSKAFIIAEAGINHNGDEKIAKNLIDCAVKAGVDAVKFQAFKTEHLVLKNTGKALYQLKNTPSNESQFDMLKRLEITKNQIKKLKTYCEEEGILFLATPFDEYSLKELGELKLPAYKVSSTDITNLPFLRKIAKKGKPVILSTGMAYLSDVKNALKEIYPFNKSVILLQCTSSYPINKEEANLNVINTYREKFDILVGFSDHSEGMGAAPYAVVMGAKVVEKHFTLDKKHEGPDHRASLTPEELRQFVSEIRIAEKYLGSGIKAPTISELDNRKAALKYLVSARKIKKGERFTEDNISAKRTGGIGRFPACSGDVIGKKAGRDYVENEII